jgi:hypothetical protein
MVSEAAAAYSSGVGSSPNGASMLAGPYPLDDIGTRVLALLSLLLFLLSFTLNNPLLLLPWLLSWPFSSAPTGLD